MFAAGDVRLDSMKRVASAVGEGRWRSSSCTATWRPSDARRGPPAARALRRADRRPARPAAGRDGEEVPIEPGTDLFHEGEHADSWWVLVDGALDLVRARRWRGDRGPAGWTRPGQWAGGFRAWDEHGVYLATGRGAVPGRMLRVPADGAARPAAGVVPVRRPPDRRPLRAPPAASSRRSRQRESLVTLGTLAAGLAHELNNPAAAATRSVDALDARLLGAARLARAAGRRRPHAPTSSRALDELRQQVAPAAVDARPDPARRRRGGAHHLAGAPRRRAGLDDRPAARRRRGGRGLVRAGGGRAAGGPTLEPGLGLGGQHALGRSADRGGAGGDPPDLRAGGGREVLHPARPGRRCSRSTSPRASRARW